MSRDHLTVHRVFWMSIVAPAFYVVQWHSLTAEVACFSLLFLYILQV